MPYSLEDKLVVGISTRALFDLTEADLIYRTEGLAAYRAYQRDLEDVPLGPGTALPLIRGLLSINERGSGRLVEVILMSRNDAESSVRIFNSVAANGLDISRGAFRGGRDPWPYLNCFRCKLFLSAEPDDVVNALSAGFPAALICQPPEQLNEDLDEVRIAFDADAVIFDGASQDVFDQKGLSEFLRQESERASEPMMPGPFHPFLMALKEIQDKFPDAPPIRTALVTARNAPAHKRVVNTLRNWGVGIDETYFLGGISKADVLAVLKPHIFFDDQMAHLMQAQLATPSAHVIRRPAPTGGGPVRSETDLEEGRFWIDKIKSDLKGENKKVPAQATQKLSEIEVTEDLPVTLATPDREHHHVEKS